MTDVNKTQTDSKLNYTDHDGVRRRDQTRRGDSMMYQFYVSRHAGGVTYLCLRDPNHPWYGTPVRRLA